MRLLPYIYRTLEDFMAGDDLSNTTLPDDIEQAIRIVMQDTGYSRNEIVVQLMSYFFELVDDAKNEDVPPLVKKVREARLREN